MIIAIDGPAGSGKSTIAKLVARKLGFQYLDTGAMYRAVAWLAAHEGVDPDNTSDMEELTQTSHIEFGYTPGEELPTKVSINDHDVTEVIRTPEIDGMVSVVAAIPEVRAALVEQQRDIAKAHDSVLEGRDIGSTVFPDADVKIYLTATADVRAQRRAKQNIQRHGRADLNQVYEALLERDRLDSSRSCSPLSVPPGAHEVDTSDMGIEEVVDAIIALANDVRKEAAGDEA